MSCKEYLNMEESQNEAQEYDINEEQYLFVNSLIDFSEETNEWNSRDILPAFSNGSDF